MRKLNRQNIANYIEIYVHCPLEECIRRDTKGLYKSALDGLTKNFLGVDEAYEEPEDYDLKVNTKLESEEQSIVKIKNLLMQTIF